MSRPINVDLPHKLGREEARRRIAANIDKLESHIPGGAAVTSRWEGDTLKLDVATMGQSVASDIRVEETLVNCRIELPGMLALFAGPIEAMLSRKGGDLLLEDKRD
ncbi:polyhydroxyalkanoic acid system family protein [Sphingomonas mesophila]|uniref:polyhydroxyalkanoic acid system family protein n=1 Tax=Sphingomonas mesophila TaxID=2303576 RepID=UPI000E58FF54|nr:polyhydroxyalkanoic acid system family protein [Sphingomonas mesophila]